MSLFVACSFNHIALLERPWAHDDVDKWIERFSEEKKHELAVVFVDNSGADIILGVFPFVRELIQNGTKGGESLLHYLN